MDGLRLEGFLSGELAKFEREVTMQFSKIIAEAHGASRAAMKLFEMKIKNPSPSTVVALLLWPRCVASCQAAILLGQKGMGIEGLTLLRNAFESLFHFAALLQDPTVLPRLRNKDDYERLKQATALAGHHESMEVLSQENRLAVEAFIRSKTPQKNIITAFDCAKIAGLEGLYHSAYRTLSLQAAHPSLTTAGHALGESLLDWRFGPSTEHLDEVFGLARDCLNMGRGFVDNALKLKI